MTKMVEEAARLCGLDCGDFKLALHFVDLKTISDLNSRFVGHKGITDVITFDYRDDQASFPNDVSAEIFVCPEAARMVSEKNSKTAFADEMTLYIVHGLLHVSGENDSTGVERKRMRRKEKHLIGILRKRNFKFTEIFPEP